MKNKTINSEKVLSDYGNYLLIHGERPKNIFVFAQENHFDEKEFYQFFSSFEHLEKEILNDKGQLGALVYRQWQENASNSADINEICLSIKDKEKSIVENYNGFNFPHDYNGYKLMDSKVQSANIAVSEALLNKMVADAGLEIEQIVNGWWKDGQYENAEHIMQDMVILVKR